MTDDLSGLFDGSRRPDVYLAPAGESSLPERLAAAGWRVAVIEPLDSLDEFYDQLRVVLDFPPYFGRNLDALWDCLTDLFEPTVVIIKDWTRFASAADADWRRLLSVLTDRVAEPPAFAVLLTGPP